ncbi:MAG: DNA methyltransferase [Candidatus Bathyarchaeota archaeon]|nr:DNA methyltransferase [Candidatus Bathyarchaeota archaeon]
MRFPNGTTEHPINKSGKREILVSVWDFGVVHPQSERSHYLCNDHPAKMRPCLARAILQLYGESPVLDPMAGIGTTLIEAELLGMDAVGVEYEKKFVNQANKNIAHLKKLYQNRNLGRAICIKGDARNLSCLNNPKVSSIVFSPPYSEGIGHAAGKNANRKYSWRLKLQKKMTEAWSNGSIAKLRYGDKSNIGQAENYGSIIFSPPYFNALKRGDEGPHSRSKKISYQDRVKRFQGYSTDSANIGNIPKFGSIVLSPPYNDALSITKGGGSKNSIICEESTKELQTERNRPFAAKKNLPIPYSSKHENIGNISEFGSIVFSPPYEGALNSSKHVGGIALRDPQLAKTCRYSEDIKNIGNTTGKTYLGAMLKVYSECYRVLKPRKFMVVVVKDIQRCWKTIPIGADTIKLCQLAGFDLHDIIINKMYFPSFWMLNLAKKAQAEANKGTKRFHALKVHEYILVFRKPQIDLESRQSFKPSFF